MIDVEDQIKKKIKEFEQLITFSEPVCYVRKHPFTSLEWNVEGELCIGGVYKEKGWPIWVAVKRTKEGKWLIQEIEWYRSVACAPKGDEWRAQQLAFHLMNKTEAVQWTSFHKVNDIMVEADEWLAAGLEHAYRNSSMKAAFE